MQHSWTLVVSPECCHVLGKAVGYIFELEFGERGIIFSKLARQAAISRAAGGQSCAIPESQAFPASIRPRL